LADAVGEGFELGAFDGDASFLQVLAIAGVEDAAFDGATGRLGKRRGGELRQASGQQSETDEDGEGQGAFHGGWKSRLRGAEAGRGGGN